jgi:Spy/CpxP family protein refolding chaperone
VRKVVEGARRDRLRKSTDLKIARMDLQSLLRAEKVDEKAIGAKLAEMQAAQGALLKIRVDSALAMKRILTPEQQKKLGEVRRERGMGRPRPQMRGGRGFSPGREGDQEESLRLDPLVVR